MLVLSWRQQQNNDLFDKLNICLAERANTGRKAQGRHTERLKGIEK